MAFNLNEPAGRAAALEYQKHVVRIRNEATRVVAAEGQTPTVRADALEDLQAFLTRVKDQPPLGWYIPGLIPDEGICLWHGQPRDFKTLTALAVSLALAGGYDALGSARFHVAAPVKVAYFSEEDPERLFAARLHWLTVKDPMPAPEYFFPFIRKSLSFDSADDCDFMIRKLQETGAQFTVFDPVRSYTGLSDKGPADLHPVILFLRRVQNETRAKVILLIHHDTKPLAVAPTNGATRSRSQQASGGGIFSISDCLVSFKKLEWNKVAAFPEDYKLSGDPMPFEITFETDERNGVDGPQFGSWVHPVAATKVEQDIIDGAAAKRILGFLRSHRGQWHTTDDIRKGAGLQTGNAGLVLKDLLAEGLVLYCEKDAAKALGRSSNAKLWSVVVDSGVVDQGVEECPY